MTVGRAAAIINQNENQDIFTASASGTTRLALTNAGQLEASDGTVSAPGYSFLTDPNTGIYRSASDTLDFTAGGERALSLNTASGTGVNYLAVTPSATTTPVAIAPAGTDSNIGLNISSLGTGTITLSSANATGTGTSAGLAVATNSLSSGTGSYFTSSSITTGTLVDINTGAANTLTSGTVLNVKSASTALTTGGKLAYFNWEPASPATTSADLVQINIGAAGDITGSLFNVTDSGSSLFKIGTSKITSAIPHEFTATGDVSIAYDLVFTNQTASTIDSYGPLTIRSGESFESNNLTLKTYNSGNIIMDTGGNVAVGNFTPAFQLHVQDSQSATASAMIENTSTNADADGLIVKLGYTGTGSTTNNFVAFLNGNGVIHGKIASTGSSGVNYATSGIDFAEYFVKDSSEFTAGEVTALSQNGVTKAATPYDSKLLGVVSAHPGFSGGEDGSNKVLVAIAGQIPVKIDPASPAITPGDYLTASATPGLAVKATRPGFVIAKALESWNPVNPTDTILTYATTSWVDPTYSLAFDESGNLTVSGQITAADVTTPIPETSLANLKSQITNLESQVASASAELLNLKSLIENQNATLSAQLAELTVLGDATISGQLSVSGPSLLADTTIAGKLYIGLLKFDDLEASLESLTGTITAKGDLAVTGTLIAQKYNVDTSDVLASSIGKAVIPTGTQELTIATTAVSTASAIFVTPEDPVTVSASATDSGRFTLRIPQVLPRDLNINWWVIN
jgi:hypothetical protein